MSAIDNAEKAMRELAEKHGDKMLDLWGTKGGDWWTIQSERKAMQQDKVRDPSKLRWAAIVQWDDRPVRVEKFETQKEAREWKRDKLGIQTPDLSHGFVQAKNITRNERGMKVEQTCIILRADHPRAKELISKLPKPRTKVRPPKRHQMDLFR